MAKSTNRLVSLDIFRGLTIVFMIIVNTPGSWEYVYAPLRHAKWHGCTPTDLVFPFFLFIVGVSTFYSLRKYGNEFNTGSVIRIIRRMFLIFAVGLFLSVFPRFVRDYSTLRILGVLQRIALAYGIGAVLCLTIRRDFLWIIVAVILLGYWSLLALFGGSDPFSLENNLAAKVDMAILGADHIYKGFGIPFEPEGLLSTIPAVATVIIGYFTGEMISRSSEGGRTVIKLFLFGAASAGLGLLWGLFFPINKPMWTSSYVLLTAGLAMGLLALIYLLADVFKFQKWGTFFLVFGTNAIFAYTLAGIWTKTMLYIIKLPSGTDQINLYQWLYQRVFVPVAGNMNGSLLFAITQVIIVWSVVLILYRKKIFIKL
jgi:predicted acyltransferase